MLRLAFLAALDSLRVPAQRPTPTRSSWTVRKCLSKPLLFSISICGLCIDARIGFDFDCFGRFSHRDGIRENIEGDPQKTGSAHPGRRQRRGKNNKSLYSEICRWYRRGAVSAADS